MVSKLFFRRPPYVPSSTVSTAGGVSTKEEVEGRIPVGLSLELLLAGRTCPPCTINDFMNYLLYVEHSAENLQFLLWLRDYEKRWEALPQSEKDLAPVWDQNMGPPSPSGTPRVPQTAAAKYAQKVLSTTDFGNKANRANHAMGPKPCGDRAENPFLTPLPTPDGSSPPADTLAGSAHYAAAASGAFEAVDLKWKPFTIQPYRDEISRIIACYITEGASRELNISTRDRVWTLHALTHTTHPSAFQALKTATEWMLRFQAHPNFIRWSISNGNKPRLIFGRVIGVGWMVMGIVAAVLLILSSRGKGWRALAAIPWFLGVSMISAGLYGMCLVMHSFHRRQSRPWEQWGDAKQCEVETQPSEWDPMDPFGGTNQSFEDRPWCVKYRKKCVCLKIFCKQILVEDPALREIQNNIFWQSIAIGFISAAGFFLLTAVLPKGNLY